MVYYIYQKKLIKKDNVEDLEKELNEQLNKIGRDFFHSRISKVETNMNELWAIINYTVEKG